MKFIDLFAGIGGFHLALGELGHKCVFASEISEELAGLYEQNFGIKAQRDIRKVKPEEIPDHDILCAGFPCQPFSKAGKQHGMKDSERGTLFDEIVKILKSKKPKFFILENVPFIKRQDNEKTWKYIEKTLKDEGYDIDSHQISPHDFGIPQHRKRLFIVGVLEETLNGRGFAWPVNKEVKEVSITSVLTENCQSAKSIEKEKLYALELWQEFLNNIPKNVSIPKVPIWGMEYSASYPFEDTTPFAMSSVELLKYRGSFGALLYANSKEEQMKLLPKYATTPQENFPNWKKKFIRDNRAFFVEYKKKLAPIMKKISKLPVSSWQKLEWNVTNSESRDIFQYIIQFRASGIRVKNKTFAPSLVCTSTQVPILGWQKRYLSVKEAAKLQSIKGIKLPKQSNAAFRALGNAVNVLIVKKIACNLLVKK